MKDNLAPKFITFPSEIGNRDRYEGIDAWCQVESKTPQLPGIG